MAVSGEFQTGGTSTTRRYVHMAFGPWYWTMVQIEYAGNRDLPHIQFVPWYWTMVQIEYAGDRDFQVQGNVFGRPGGRATDRRARTGHTIRTSGSRGGADQSGNTLLLARVRETLHRDLRRHHRTCRSI